MRVKFVLYLLGVVLVALAVSAATTASKKKASKEDKDPAKKRLQTIEEKLLLSPVLSLSDSNFTKFTADRPRDYRAILMFTATDPKYSCSVCNRVKGTFEEVAKLYQSQYNFTALSPEDRLVFFRLEVDDARAIFGELRLETVPRLYALPPTTSKSPKVHLAELEFDARAFMEGLAPALKQIHETTKVKIEILIDPMIVLLSVGLVSIVLALFVSSASVDLWGTMFWYQSPKIWVVVSMICFGVGVSGSIFCIIRSAPPFGFSRNGGLVIFATQGRDQFLVEGIVVALWTLGCALAYFIMYQSTKLRFPVLRHVGVLFGMTLFIVLGEELWTAYGAKTAWYSLRETLPAQVWQFLSSSVKKNSGIVKRLLRLSELWMVDVKDFETLRKKFDLLIVEYVKRVAFTKAT